MRSFTKFGALAAAFALSWGLAAPAFAIPHAEAPVTAQSKDTLLPTGTLFRIAMNSSISSAHSKTGDKFTFTVVDDVKIGDRIAIPAGTAGTGTVERAAPAHGGQVDGILRVQFDPIKLPDGTLVDADITQESLSADQNQHNGLAGSVADVADITLPGFFLIDFLRKGNDVTLGAGAPFHVAVIEDAYLPQPVAQAPAAPVPASSPSPVPSTAP
jgi:hypothetical protein